MQRAPSRISTARTWADALSRSMKRRTSPAAVAVAAAAVRVVTDRYIPARAARLVQGLLHIGDSIGENRQQPDRDVPGAPVQSGLDLQGHCTRRRGRRVAQLRHFT